MLKIPYFFHHHLVKNLLELKLLRSASTGNNHAVNVYKINHNLSFRPALNSHLADRDRPIVLIYGWLVAKARHIYKYGDFYLGKGFDVVHIKVTPDQLLRPSRAQAVVGSVLDFVSQSEHSTQPLLYHGFSVGGYLFGETLVKIHDNPEVYGQVGKRFKGQVYDSPVDFEGIPRGFSRAVTDNVALQKTLSHFLESYLRLFYNSTTRHYLRASEAMKANQLKVPTLFMYSKSDPIAVPDIINDVVELYRTNGIEAHKQCFTDSGHVGHFHRYPVEYISVLRNYLEHIGLLNDEYDAKRIKIS